jgi:hypothetical protein
VLLAVTPTQEQAEASCEASKHADTYRGTRFVFVEALTVTVVVGSVLVKVEITIDVLGKSA